MRAKYLHAFVLFLLPAALVAQGPFPPEDAAPRVRLFTLDREGPRGPYSLVRVTADSIILSNGREGETLGFARRTVRRIEVSAGKRSRAMGAAQGIAVGAVAGTALGAIAGLYFGYEETVFWPIFDWKTVMTSIGTGAIAGGTIGGAVGAMWPGEHWRRHPLDRGVSLIQRQGMLGLSIAR